MIETDVLPLPLGPGGQARVRDAFGAASLDPELVFVVVGDEQRAASLPLRFVWNEPIREDALARARSGAREGWIVDAGDDGTTALTVERAMRAGTTLGEQGRLIFALEGEAPREATSSQRLGSALGAQRWILDDERLVTLHRAMPRVEDSAVAFLRHLRERGYTAAPLLHGTALYVDPAGTAWVAATSQSFVSHPDDADSSLREILHAGRADERLLRSAELIADGLAALHRALATPGSDPSFTPQPLRAEDLAGWQREARADLEALIGARTPGVAELRERVARAIDALPRQVSAGAGRAHGRLTLGRVLLVEGLPVFVGFGEAVAAKSSPLKDVASLTRSFEAVARESVAEAAHDPTSDLDRTRSAAHDITARARETFLRRYFERAAGLPTLPADLQERDALFRFFRVAQSIREVRDAFARTPATLPATVEALAAECP